MFTVIKDDLYRYTGDCSFKSFMKTYLFVPGFRFSFWMRVSKLLLNKKMLRPLFYFSVLRWRHYAIKYGIHISYKANIGNGLYIGHCGGMIIGHLANIGKNFNISQGVTIGRTNRGDKKGRPIIGNNVYIGAGAKLIGNITIGNNVAIGANAVVTHSVPDNAVVAGIPARIISYRGAEGYVERTIEEKTQYYKSYYL